MTENEEGIDTYLRVGEVVVLDLDPALSIRRRFTTFVRGWQRFRHITLDRPKDKGRYVPMQEGQACIARFIVEGTACGFNSVVLDSDNWGEACQCRIAWPESFQAICFRKHERVKLGINCKVVLPDGVTEEAQMRDISMGGCALVTPVNVGVGEQIRVLVKLPESARTEDASLTVRNVREIGDNAFLLGCELCGEQEYIQSDIAFLVATRLDRKTGEPERPRVLIVDGDSESGGSLWRAFREQGCDTFMATNAIDGLSRLCVLHPAALVINHGMQGAIGTEMVRLVRNTAGFERLPVFLFGGNPDDQQAILQAGATMWLSSPAAVVERCKSLLTFLRTGK